MHTHNSAAEITRRLKEMMAGTFDFESRELHTGTNHIQLLYISGICDPNVINRYITEFFYQTEQPCDYETYLSSLSGCSKTEDVKETLQAMWSGAVAICLQDIVFIYGSKKFEASAISESPTETVLIGPSDALTESVSTNIRMIRQRYLAESLAVEQRQVGAFLKIPVAFMYDRNVADPRLLADFRQKLEQMSRGSLQRVDQFQKLLTSGKSSLFPTVMMTDRPDRIVKNVTEGKIVLLVEGNNQAFVVPSAFFDFVSSMADLYHLQWVGIFFLIVRYLGLFITIVLPALYVAITSYNPELLRIELALTMSGGRAMIPYPSFVEVSLMLLMMEMLAEASIRLPKVIGPAGTTVGGLILGQAATEAGLVSNIMVIIVSAVAISNFLIPVQSMSFAVRVIKYPFLLLATFFGLFGIIVGIIGLTFYLIELPNFGKPYLQLFAQEGDLDQKDVAR